MAILFHTLGGAVSSTCSASSTLPLPSVTRAELVGHRDRPHRRAGHDARRADRGGELGRELLVAALAAIDLRFRPVLLEAAALHHRQVAQIALPLGDDAVVGHHHRVQRRLADRRGAQLVDPIGQRPLVERFGVRAPSTAGRRRPSPRRVTMVLNAFSISSHSCSDCSAVSCLPLSTIGASSILFGRRRGTAARTASRRRPRPDDSIRSARRRPRRSCPGRGPRT